MRSRWPCGVEGQATRSCIIPIAEADTSEAFQRLLTHLRLTCSMSRSGNVWDNSVMEAFFSTLKTERTARHHYRTRNAARAGIFDFIERFYNPIRRHSTLGNLSPANVERGAAVA
jgi:putative transposase